MNVLSIRRIFRKNLLFVSLRLRSLGQDPKNYIVQKDITDICIDGYPRSANSFSVRMFRKANPGAVIAHHTHAVANIRKAIDCSIPIVVLIRNPEQAIVSSVIAHENNDIDNEIYRYIDFYDWILKKISNVVIADFDIVVNDYNAIILNVNNHFKKSYDFLEDVKEADVQVKNDIEERFDVLGQSKMSHIKPIPTSARDSVKEELRASVLKHKDFCLAKKIYDDIMLHVPNH